LAADVAIQSVTIMVAVPVYLSLRIGSPGSSIDRISFQITKIPGSGAVPGQSTGAYPVAFRAQGRLTSPGTVRLTANSSQPLSDGMGHTISFDQISWEGSGVMPAGRFSGSSNQTVWLQSVPRSFNLQGSMSFFYDNALYVPAGNYHGRVTYTLSSP